MVMKIAAGNNGRCGIGQKAKEQTVWLCSGLPPLWHSIKLWVGEFQVSSSFALSTWLPLCILHRPLWPGQPPHCPLLTPSSCLPACAPATRPPADISSIVLINIVSASFLPFVKVEPPLSLFRADVTQGPARRNHFLFSSLLHSSCRRNPHSR